ncbi:protein TRACHEARY ELEMENT DIFFERENTIATION-RELATED 7A-like [Portunus trituberculatus]|uniref:protein TRACHEARY ELEMENT DIFFERENTIATION-RELATED 7A-like n=1 Tax=Portunus trituberculatus TaxID=210409 RepID=UPI001E1CB369|nr:protein TRACHEARY ELEMENT DIFFERENTIATION-RELATED 7A-like [Portunus trituberculatus]
MGRKGSAGGHIGDGGGPEGEVNILSNGTVKATYLPCIPPPHQPSLLTSPPPMHVPPSPHTPPPNTPQPDPSLFSLLVLFPPNLLPTPHSNVLAPPPPLHPLPTSPHPGFNLPHPNRPNCLLTHL